MVQRKETTPTLPILDAIDRLFNDIRKAHPEVPKVTIVLGAKGAKKGSITYGHFHAGQWNGEDAPHELMLSGEGLSRGALPTLGTLLHEAAHALAHARGVDDTSNNGRYHNKKFKEIGEELGLVLTTAPTRGWTGTELAEGTAEKYSRSLEALTAALVTYKKHLPAGEVTKPGPRRSTKIKIDCECSTPVTVSKIWFEEKLHGIECGDCFSKFEIVEEN